MEPELHDVNLKTLSREESPGLFSVIVYYDLII